MNSDAKLQKIILGPDWIDLSFGEPVVVTQAMFRQLNRMGSAFKMPNMYELPKWTYQPAAGNPEFVEFLEDKYDAKVVVTNGAKHALAATLHAFKKSGIETIYYDVPYYPANPSLVQATGLKRVSDVEYADSLLVASPNNPDGRNYSNVDLVGFRHRIPFIHDAAYYNEIYLPKDQMVLPLGSVQIFSLSKMYGLSGLRIGYAVCHNEKYYKDVTTYVETTTAGVSIASQVVAMNVEQYFAANPNYLKEFHSEARKALLDARKELEKLDPEVLVVEPAESVSMFAWCKVGPRLDNKSAKVHMLPGEIFGQPGMMRLNIAHPVEVIREAVDRLNKHKI